MAIDLQFCKPSLTIYNGLGICSDKHFVHTNTYINTGQGVY